MARTRAEWLSDKSRRPDAFDDYHDINRTTGWIGATGALLGALVVAIEALTGFHPGH